MLGVKKNGTVRNKISKVEYKRLENKNKLAFGIKENKKIATTRIFA
jgi:hypothetical protein